MIVTRARIACAIALAAFPPGAIAAAATPSSFIRLDGSRISTRRIDRIVTMLMTRAHVPGLELALIGRGKLAYLKTYGLRRAKPALAMDADTVMTGASFTKSAVAYLAARLVDDGVLRLDEPLDRILPRPLPGYPDYQDLAGDPRWRKITVRMLLSHTSGLPNLRRFEDDRKLRIKSDPGSGFHYSGEGLRLLQLVIETVTGQPLQEEMQRRLFKPLAMTRTSMVWEPRFEEDHADGHDEDGGDLGPQRRGRADAAGSMQTTARDYSRLVAAMLAGEGLSRGVWREMLKSQVRIRSARQFPTFGPDAPDGNAGNRLSYGLGWGLYWSPYGEAFFKEGHDDGWRNYAVAFLDSKTALIVMTNSSNGEDMFEALIERILANPYTPIAWEGYASLGRRPAASRTKSEPAVSGQLR